jgi:hypothetical protein
MKFEHTQYGFSWGPLTVTRQISDPKFGVQVELLTSAGSAIEIRVTPSGRLRIGQAKKVKVEG